MVGASQGQGHFGDSVTSQVNGTTEVVSNPEEKISRNRDFLLEKTRLCRVFHTVALSPDEARQVRSSPVQSSQVKTARRWGPKSVICLKTKWKRLYCHVIRV